MLTNEEREAGMERLERGFMTPEVVRAPHAVSYETMYEGTIFDLDGAGGDVSREIDAEEIEDGPTAAPGWYARLSASGYMDCTDWNGPFKTREEAEAFLVETYDD